MYTNIYKSEIFHVLYDKVALLTRRHSEHGKINESKDIFKKVWTRYIQNFHRLFYDSDEIEARRPC